MSPSPYEALNSLRSLAATGELTAMCERHGVELLVAHGSVLDSEPLRPARDLDLAFRYERGAVADQVRLINDLIGFVSFDGVDLMNLGRAGPVARARALGPASVVLYESRKGVFAEAQLAAITEEMETRWMRERDLELLAGR